MKGTSTANYCGMVLSGVAYARVYVQGSIYVGPAGVVLPLSLIHISARACARSALQHVAILGEVISDVL